MLMSWPSVAFVDGVKSGSGQLVRLAQPGRQRVAADRRRWPGSPSSRSRPGSRGRRTRSGSIVSRRTSIERPARSGLPAPPRGSRPCSTLSRWLGTSAARALEPEPRERGQHAALVGDRRRQHDVERRDAVGRDQQQLVAEAVQLTHLPGGLVQSRDRVSGMGHLQAARVRSKISSTWRGTRRGRRPVERRRRRARPPPRVGLEQAAQRQLLVPGAMALRCTTS